MSSTPARRGDAPPAGYPQFLEKLKRRLAAAQARAALAVNSELIRLYWELGNEILQREEREGWGAKVIDRLAADLRREFPDMTGLSRSNLKYMRAFASAWRFSDAAAIGQQAVGQLPWGHNIVLITKLDDQQTRLWYAARAAEHGWSRSGLVAQIASQMHERQGAALTSLESALLADVQSFLLEMGRGFALAGRQYELRVPDEETGEEQTFFIGPALLQLRPAAVRGRRSQDRGLQAGVRRQAAVLRDCHRRAREAAGGRVDDRADPVPGAQRDSDQVGATGG